MNSGFFVLYGASLMVGLLLAFLLRDVIIPLLIERYENQIRVGLGCVATAFVVCLPWFVIVKAGVRQFILVDFSVAGAVLGLAIALFLFWPGRQDGVKRFLMTAVLGTVGGAWFANMLLVSLIAIASD